MRCHASKPKSLPRARVGAEYGGKTNHDVSHFAAGQGEVVLKDTILDTSGHCAIHYVCPQCSTVQYSTLYVSSVLVLYLLCCLAAIITHETYKV